MVLQLRLKPIEAYRSQHIVIEQAHLPQRIRYCLKCIAVMLLMGRVMADELMSLKRYSTLC